MFIARMILFSSMALVSNVSNAAKFEGTYSTISESEWSVSFVLKPGGMGEMIHESWMPGESKKADIERKDLKWSSNGNEISIKSDGETFVYKFNPKLVFDDGPPPLQGPGIGLVSSSDPKESNSLKKLWLEPKTWLK